MWVRTISRTLRGVFMKRIFTPSQIKKIIGATGHEKIHIPFYYAPPLLDVLRKWIESRLASKG